MIILRRLYCKYPHLILYGIIGGFTSFLDFCVFTILSTYVGLDYLMANCISVLVGISTSFLLNRAYNFKVRDKAKLRFAIFLTVGVCGLLLSNLILWFCIYKLHIGELMAKLASIVLVVGFQFLLNKFVTFRVKK